MAGGITGALALSKTSKIKANCVDGHCPAAQQDDGEKATLFARVSTVTFAVGGAGVLAGIILAIVQPGATSNEIGWRIGPGSVGYQLRF